jgi:hypothetical protein
MKQFLSIIPFIAISFSSLALPRAQYHRQESIDDYLFIKYFDEHITWLKRGINEQMFYYPQESQINFKNACQENNAIFFQQQLATLSAYNVGIIKEKIDVLVELSRSYRFPQEICAYYLLWDNAVNIMQKKQPLKEEKSSFFQRFLCCKTK